MRPCVTLRYSNFQGHGPIVWWALVAVGHVPSTTLRNEACHKKPVDLTFSSTSIFDRDLDLPPSAIAYNAYGREVSLKWTAHAFFPVLKLLGCYRAATSPSITILRDCLLEFVTSSPSHRQLVILNTFLSLNLSAFHGFLLCLFQLTYKLSLNKIQIKLSHVWLLPSPSSYRERELFTVSYDNWF